MPNVLLVIIVKLYVQLVIILILTVLHTQPGNLIVAQIGNANNNNVIGEDKR